mmetsp:Transcript_71573/g.167586  ORF Transcript_71573/g.167586 Transcript_71573/m.167586 type:complete len:224 (-) Transcript_71573:551-1222(-)
MVGKMEDPAHQCLWQVCQTQAPPRAHQSHASQSVGSHHGPHDGDGEVQEEAQGREKDQSRGHQDQHVQHHQELRDGQEQRVIDIPNSDDGVGAVHRATRDEDGPKAQREGPEECLRHALRPRQGWIEAPAVQVVRTGPKSEHKREDRAEDMKNQKRIEGPDVHVDELDVQKHRTGASLGVVLKNDHGEGGHRQHVDKDQLQKSPEAVPPGQTGREALEAQLEE